jgi:hypothetical protein
MTILILGPSTWLPGTHPPSPHQLGEALPPGWESAGSTGMSPLDVRVSLAALRTRRGAPAIALEAEETSTPPNVTRKFHALMEKHWVEDYYVYWPFGGARAGTGVEIGFLLEQTSGVRPKLEAHHVTMFYEDDGFRRRAASLGLTRNGHLTFDSLERSRRTRYYGDLVDLGAIAKSWRNHDELVERVLARAGVAD